jgi:hypothetical protein
MLASYFVPLVHLDDHPDADRDSMQLRISLPTAVEAFVRQRYPDSERIELCHDDKQVVVRHGWQAIAEGCKPQPGDRIIRVEES